VAIIQDNRLVLTNEVARRLLRIESEARAAQADIFTFIDEEFREPLRERMQRRLVAEGDEPSSYATRLRRADGEPFEAELHVRRVQQLGRSAVQCVVIDISDRVRLEEQQRHSQKMEAVGTLAGGIAHDFNNLITVILGMSHMLRGRSGAADIADMIEKAANQAATLTGQLLRFARRGEATFEPVDMHVVIRDVVDIVGCAVDRGVEFEVRPGAHRATVYGDAVQLQQVVLNLLINARDAMPQGGRVVVQTRNPRGKEIPNAGADPPLEVCVSDSGPGIPSEIADRVFEPYFSTKPVGKGSGMGLSVVYGILRRHHGSVRFESPPGGGAKFIVHLATTEPPH
jgi:PAS domain S-box-containing protein